VVHAPALQATYTASLGAGAMCNGKKIFASSRAKLYGAKVGGPRGLVTTVSNLRRLDLETEPRIPSLAYRLARVAEGSLDAALASVDSHDWDIAAGEILLIEAGAGVRDVHGHELIYNGAETRRGLLAAGPLKLLPALVDALGRAVRSRPR
jgi:myo-inositol-1(or 4)-monophosphatase